MRLVLELPEGWVADRHGDGQLIRIGDAPGVKVEVSSISPLPDDPARWARAEVANVPEGTELHIVQAGDVTTVDGWPVTVIESHAVAPATKAVVERRLHFLYRFLLHCARVVVKSASPDQFEATRGALLEVFGRARPDFSGDIVALSQIVDVI